MNIETEIKKWGHSKAIRLSGAMAEIPNFAIGTKIMVVVTEDGLTIKKLEKPKKCLPFSEEELIADMTPHSAHADELVQPLPSEL